MESKKQSRLIELVHLLKKENDRLSDENNSLWQMVEELNQSESEVAAFVNALEEEHGRVSLQRALSGQYVLMGDTEGEA